MYNEMKGLSPKVVFDCFAQVCQVPRPSKCEEKIIELKNNVYKNAFLLKETRTISSYKSALAAFETIPCREFRQGNFRKM